MARRRSKPLPLPAETEAAPATLAALIDQAMIEKIMANISLDTMAFEAKSMFSTSVRKPDGAWRTRTIEAGTDFALTGIRLGARGHLLFAFKPLEPTEYEIMELPEKEFDVFEGFREMVIKALGYNPGPTLVGTRERAYTWEQAKSSFRKHEADRRREMTVLEVKEKEKAAVDDYGTNPMFGSW